MLFPPERLRPTPDQRKNCPAGAQGAGSRWAAGKNLFVYVGGNSESATIAAKANLDALRAEYHAFVREVRRLSGQNAALQEMTQNAADAVSQANTNINMRVPVKTQRLRLPDAITPLK